MSGFARTVSKVAGVVASVAAFIPGGQPIALIAAGAAIQWGLIADLTAPKPPIRGNVSDITIGADQPTPYMVGETYCGGALVHQTGYGAAINKVENPYLFMAVVYSAGGPIAGIDQYCADFEPVTFGGDGWATGYFGEILYRQSYLGGLLQTTALGGPWGAIPDWGATSKLSGKAHGGWSLKWDSKNGKYQSGAPQLGIIGRGVLTWDPRADSNWPGGSGAQRWASPKDRAAFDAARATWAYTNRPGLHALRYALGTWERDLNSATSNYVLTFGIGLPVDQIVVEDFVALENVCEANGWTVSGVLYEPGDKMANLKRLLGAGGADVCWKGGRLGLKLRVPRVSLDTITRDDLAEGEISVAGGVAWRDRLNAVIPKYRSADHKWSMQAAGKLNVPGYIASDGEEKLKEVPFECVIDPDQAAELAAYELYDSREQQPIVLPVGPRLRGYHGGDRLSLSAELVADLGVLDADGDPTSEVIVLSRDFDPDTMTGTLTLAGETMAKHTLALSVEAQTPQPISLPTTAEYDLQALTAFPLLLALADDGLLDPTEKIKILIPLDEELENGWELLDAQAADAAGFGPVDTARAALAAARTAWIAYRDSLDPDWDDITTVTPIDRATYDAKLLDYRQGVVALQDALRQYAGLPTVRGAYQVRAVMAPGTSNVVFPVSGSTDTTMTVVSHDVLLEDGRRSGVDFGTFPAATISGLTASTKYGVFWDFAASAYVTEAFPAPVAIANQAMIFYDYYSTTDAAGEQVADPTPPASWRGPTGRGDKP